MNDAPSDPLSLLPNNNSFNKKKISQEMNFISEEKDAVFEVFEEVKKSVVSEINKENFDAAFEGINRILCDICGKIENLRIDAYKVTPIGEIEVKQRNQQLLSSKISSMISETLSLLQKIKSFSFKNKSDKIGAVSQAADFEGKCMKYKQNLEEILTEIEARKGKKMVKLESKFSVFSDFSLGADTENLRNTRNSFMEEDGRVNKPFDSNMSQIGNAPPYKKLNTNLSTFSLINVLNTKNPYEISLEKKMMTALEDQRKNCFVKHWKTILIVLIIAALLLMYLIRER